MLLFFHLLAPVRMIEPQHMSWSLVCVSAAAFFLQRHLRMQALVREIWQACNAGPFCTPGPISIICQVVASLGWVWEAPCCFVHPGGRFLPVVELWKHEVRDGIRLEATTM